jgi:hypothetical protein
VLGYPPRKAIAGRVIPHTPPETTRRKDLHRCLQISGNMP